MKKLLKNITHFFRKEKIDWLDEQPYLGKYFIYKINRLIMNVVYKVVGYLEESKLEKYFAEFEFENQTGDFQATMPIIILVRNNKEAKDVVAKINSELIKRYDFKLTKAGVEKQLLTEPEYKKKELALQDNLRSLDKKQIGNISFDTVLGAKLDTKTIPFQIEDSPLVGAGKISKIKLQYPVIKNGKNNPLYDIDSFLIINVTIIED